MKAGDFGAPMGACNNFSRFCLEPMPQVEPCAIERAAYWIQELWVERIEGFNEGFIMEVHRLSVFGFLDVF